MSSPYSQFGQDIHVLNTIYKGKRNGFFVDVGAYDGISMSNTYLLEKDYGWKGICIEANPKYFNKLITCRSSINIQCAVYSESDKILNFYDSAGCGGLVETNHHTYVLCDPIIKVCTQTLTSLLDDAEAPNFIDFLSIDTEGSEYDILRVHDFDKYLFGYICVEHNHIAENRAKLRELLESKGYVFYRENSVDDDYIHKSIIDKTN